MAGSERGTSVPRQRMPLDQRAKIFVPFDPLKGFAEAIHAKEAEVERAKSDAWRKREEWRGHPEDA